MPYSKDDHRLIQSLRSTKHFQEFHHQLLYNTTPDILSVGDQSDYNFRLCLGDITEKNSLMGTAFGPNDPSAKTTSESRRYFMPALIWQFGGKRDEEKGSDGTVPESPLAKDAGVSAKGQYLDVSTPRFQAPLELYSNYPLGHDQYLKSPAPPHIFFSSGSELQPLLLERVSPIVYLSGPNVALVHSSQVNYGLLMEERNDQAGPCPVQSGAESMLPLLFTAI